MKHEQYNDAAIGVILSDSKSINNYKKSKIGTYNLIMNRGEDDKNCIFIPLNLRDTLNNGYNEILMHSGWDR